MISCCMIFLSEDEEESTSLLVRFRGEQASNTRKRKQAPTRNHRVKSIEIAPSNSCYTEPYTVKNTSKNDKCMNTQVYQTNVSTTSSHPGKRPPLKESGNENCYFQNDTTTFDDVRTRPFDLLSRSNGQRCTEGTPVDSKSFSGDSKWTKFLSVEEDEFSDDGIV